MISSVLILSACQNLTPPERTDLVSVPESWSELQKSNHSDQSNPTPVTPKALRWSSLTNNATFQDLARLALRNNPTLQQQKLAINIAEANLRASNITLYVPELSVGLDADRGGRDTFSEDSDTLDPTANNTENSSNTYELSVNLRYELNIWGQLSDAKRASTYSYASQRADYQQAQQDLMFALSNAWFDLLSAHELIDLFEKRLTNQQENLNAIESRYRTGINSALDVYLARNTVEQEKSNLANQQAILQTAKRAIQVLIQNYPDADSLDDDNLPAIDTVLSNTKESDVFLQELLPSSLLTQKPNLQSAWLNVLRQNAEVAIAHKARFPSLALNASARQSSDNVNTLTSPGIFSWTIGASLLQPILNGGRLQAAEKVARLELEQTELEYINTVYNAFNTIENALTQQTALRDQLKFTQAAAINAVYAEELSFDQYQKGIVSFTTVLESQRRSFDSQAQVISLKTQIAQNSALLLSEFVADIDIPEPSQTLDRYSSVQTK